VTDDLLNLIGRRVLLQISDPWEFGTEVGVHPIPGIVEQVTASQVARRDGVTRSEEVLVRVEKPFAYKQHKCEFFRATPRHEGATFASLSTGETVSANFSRTASIDEVGEASIGLIGSICEDRRDALNLR
jgi:hypothetical protein